VFPDFHLNNSSFLRTGIFHDVLHNLLPEIKNYSPTHKSGLIHLHNDNIHLQTVLFDSGAIQSNYIDKQFVNKNIVHSHQFLQPLNYTIDLYSLVLFSFSISLLWRVQLTADTPLSIFIFIYILSSFLSTYSSSLKLSCS
jgi:hypothetical protein